MITSSDNDDATHENIFPSRSDFYFDAGWDILSIQEDLSLRRAAAKRTLAQAIKRRRILQAQLEPRRCVGSIDTPEGDDGKSLLIPPNFGTGNPRAPGSQASEGISFLDIDKQKTWQRITPVTIPRKRLLPNKKRSSSKRKRRKQCATVTSISEGASSSNSKVEALKSSN